MNDTHSNYSVSRLVGFLFGLPILLLALFNLSRALKSQSWPWTPGVIVSGEEYGMGEDQDYRFKVSYNVASAQYVCQRVDWAAAHTSRDKYRYYVGANARVYYDPRIPRAVSWSPEFPAGSRWNSSWVSDFRPGVYGLTAGSKAAKRFNLRLPCPFPAPLKVRLMPCGISPCQTAPSRRSKCTAISEVSI